MAERRSWIDPSDRFVSIRRQCAPLGLHRSNVFYEPVSVSEEDLLLMRQIVETYLQHLQARPLEGIVLVVLPLGVFPSPRLVIGVGDLDRDLHRYGQVVDTACCGVELNHHALRMIGRQ